MSSLSLFLLFLYSHIQKKKSSNLFEGLQNQKRSSDPESIARRQSISEQRITPGFLGKMWNEYVSLSPSYYLIPPHLYLQDITDNHLLPRYVHGK
ncbi:hypothetical protein QBC44DRAFT_332367 [Cladorrhinum sp. PSN332]|nr:hypothetical protein QBC44DRAFT_332367 [Cladorrhinum sp. PSN332]